MTPRPPTPALERLLASARARLRRRVWAYGIGTVLGVAAAWLSFAFFADYVLRVPFAVRVWHGFILFAVVLYFVWREFVRPFRRMPDDAGMALLLEREHPELHQVLVSAVQLAGRSDAGSPELIERVLAEAESRAGELDLTRVFDDEAPRARFLLGVGAVVGLGALAFLNPELTRIFAHRLLGGDAAWPQRTHLFVHVPDLGPGTRVEESDELIHVRVARGTDVAIQIRAEGEAPDRVTLHFEHGRDQTLSPMGVGTFRTLLRSLQDDLNFHVTGGDDDDGKPRVEVEVLQPPDVEGLAVSIEPPPYTGLPARLVRDHDVEVVHGSRLVVHVLTSPRDASGSVRLLPADESRPLEPLPFPLPEPALAPDPGDAPGEPLEAPLEAPGLAFELVAEASLGFRIELVDSKGLTNPDPGLFRVQVVEDRAPEVRVLAPLRTDFEVVSGGAIPLRVRAEDDFGLADLLWTASLDGSDEGLPPALSGHLETQPLEEPTPGELPRGLLGRTRIEVDSLGDEEHPVAVDQRFVFRVTATDNREPTPGEGRAVPLRARIVTPEELLRRLQDRLAQARLAAVRLSDLQREKKSRVQEIAQALEGGEDPGAESVALAASLSGQRRVRTDAAALARDLATICEDILYARLDDKAGALLEAYHARASVHAEPGLASAPFREIARAREEGQLGPGGFAGNLVHIVDLAFEIEEDHVAAAAVELDAAGSSVEPAAVGEHLAATALHQEAALQRLDALLQELLEWDNFQNVLALLRDILNREKALLERTQRFGTEK